MSGLIRLTPQGPVLTESDGRAFTLLAEWLSAPPPNGGRVGRGGVQDMARTAPSAVPPARPFPLPPPQGAGECILLSPADDPFALEGQFAALEAIAVDFPKPTDGRGFSIARLLRERLGWRGELRAVGQVARDQLAFMARCGFDALALREGEDAQACLRAFAEVSVLYQGDVHDPRPLFRRRAEALAALNGASQ